MTYKPYQIRYAGKPEELPAGFFVGKWKTKSRAVREIHRLRDYAEQNPQETVWYCLFEHGEPIATVAPGGVLT